MAYNHLIDIYCCVNDIRDISDHLITFGFVNTGFAVTNREVADDNRPQ